MRTILCLALALILGGCGSAAQPGASATTPSPPAQAQPTSADSGVVIDLRGVITTLDQDGQGQLSMLVEGAKEPDTTYARAIVVLTPQTSIMLRQDGGLVPATAEQLTLGRRVAVTFGGPVTRSEPGRGTASRIVILP